MDDDYLSDDEIKDIKPSEEEKEFIMVIAEVSKVQLAALINVIMTEYELEKDGKFKHLQREDAIFTMLLSLDVAKHKLLN